MRWNPAGNNFVLTRLHTRYSKDHLGEDLVFRVAEPIVGGREIRDAKGRVERGAKEASVNNFQGRYVIRHPWKGPIACKNPIRGRWGGPPAGAQKKGPRAAQDLAFAPRGKVTLRTFVNANVTSPSQMHVSKGAPLGLLASIGEGQASQPATGSGIDEPTPPVSSATGGTPPPAMPAPLTTSDAPTTPPSSPPSGGCGACSTNAPPSSGHAGWLAFAGLLWLRRRRAS